jgi:hypothetical protein
MNGSNFTNACLVAYQVATDERIITIYAFYAVVSIIGLILSAKLLHWQRSNNAIFHINARILLFNHHIIMLVYCFCVFATIIPRLANLYIAKSPCDFLSSALYCRFYIFAKYLLNFTLFNSLFFCAIERIYATVRYKTYEINAKPYLSITLVIMSWSFSFLGGVVIILPTLAHTELYSTVCGSSLTVSKTGFVVSLGTFMALDMLGLLTFYLIFRVNKVKRRKLKAAKLSAKYQLSENVRVSQVHIPMITCHVAFCFTSNTGLLFSVLRTETHLESYTQTVLFWANLSNFYTVFMPLLTIYDVPHRLGAFWRRGIMTTTTVAPASIEIRRFEGGILMNAEQVHHFETLKMAWKKQ